jgi:hypothetical protein
MAQLTFVLTRAGLAVPVWVGLTGQAVATLVTGGNQVPTPVGARGLLDTGSDLTAVASWILRRLGASKTHIASTQTASGPVMVNLYQISLGITDPTQPAGSPWLTFPGLLVSEIATQLVDADVLVGLDVLRTCKLMLDGPGQRFTLAQ